MQKYIAAVLTVFTFVGLSGFGPLALSSTVKSGSACEAAFVQASAGNIPVQGYRFSEKFETALITEAEKMLEQGQVADALIVLGETNATEKIEAVRAQLVRILSDEKPVSVKPLNVLNSGFGPTTQSFVLTYASGQKALFKPARGFWVDFQNDKEKGWVAIGRAKKSSGEGNSNPIREVWAYQIAERLGIPVPVTIQGRVEMQTESGAFLAEGSLQAFVDRKAIERAFLNEYHDISEYPTQNAMAYHASQKARLAFDFLIENRDRHDDGAGHNYFGAERLQIPFDHGLAFGGHGFNTPARPDQLHFDSRNQKFVLRLKELNSKKLAEIIDPKLYPKELAAVVSQRELMLPALEKQVTTDFDGRWFRIIPVEFDP